MTDLAKTERRELAGYGQNEDIREMMSRIRQMVPNADKIGDDGCLALAQASIALELNPFIGEIWAIPQGGGKFALSPGIKGLRKKARQQGKYQVTLRPATPEELGGVKMNPGDIARACDLYMMTPHALEVLRLTGRAVMFTGLAIIRSDDKTKMEHVQCVRKRAEADALKQAFDLSALGTYVEEPPTQWQIDNQARDEALPFVPMSRGHDDVLKETRAPHEVVAAGIEALQSGANNDVVEGKVVSSEVDESDRFGFYDRMLDEIPFFEDRKELLAALAENDMTLYHPQYESVMQTYLEGYATEHANAEAAAEGQQGLAL